MRRFFSLDLLDNRYPQLHGVRVLAIISVVQYHVTSIFALEQGVRLDRDWVMSSLAIFFGMDLFFILSGFLIGSILLYSLRNKDTQKHPIRRFYLRRVFRTFPSYYIVLTVLVFTTHLTIWQRHNLRWEYTYLTNFHSVARWDSLMFWGWSLALEEQFYLFVPILFFVLRWLKTDGQRIGLLVLIWLSALVVRLVIYFRHDGPWLDFILYGTVYFKTYTRFDTLVMGILLAVLNDRYREPIARWLREPFHRALVALPSLLCLWMLVRPWTFAPHELNLFHIFAWGTITTVMWLGFLLLLLYGEGPIHSFLGAPVFRRLATLGYGIYLVHIPLCDRVVVPMAHALDRRQVSLIVIWPLSLVVLLALSAALAYAMHLVIEKPSLWVRDRVAR